MVPFVGGTCQIHCVATHKPHVIGLSIALSHVFHFALQGHHLVVVVVVDDAVVVVCFQLLMLMLLLALLLFFSCCC
jgi:hypothetical protein